MRKYRIFGVVAVLGLVADQATKIWVRSELPLGVRRTIVDGFFDLSHSQNTGAAFSMLRDVSFGQYILAAAALIALVVIGIYVRRLPAGQPWPAVLLGLIAAGALGNLIDRVAYGHVTDFLLAHWHEHYWPVFNIADAELVVGAIGLAFSRTKWETPGKPAARTV